MKKKYIIYTVVLFLIISFTGLLLWNTITFSSITLDINPSIRINLNRKGIVKSVKALNEDAKEVVNDLEGKILNDTLDKLAENIVEKGYVDDRHLEIILYTKGKISNGEVIDKVIDSFKEQEVDTSVIIVENISKEDKKLAKKYDISPSKASYINSIIDTNENIEPEALVEKSVEELKETKQTGKYCDAGYSLEGDLCVKEIKREKASSGNVCPEGYAEYNNKCYEESSVINLEEYECVDK